MKVRPGEIIVSMGAASLLAVLGASFLKSGDGYNHSGDRARIRHAEQVQNEQDRALARVGRDYHLKSLGQPGH